MAGKPVRLLALVAIYVIVAHVLPAPDGIDAQGWRITGIFFATIAGLMLQPLPGSQPGPQPAGRKPQQLPPVLKPQQPAL